MDPKEEEKRSQQEKGGQDLEILNTTFLTTPVWAECEVEAKIKFGGTEKLHSYQIDVSEEDLTTIALQTLRTPHFPKFQEIENIQKIVLEITESKNAHMGRVFLVNAKVQHEKGEENVGKFIIKASVDELRSKGGDLFAQCYAQQLCNDNGIRAPIVYLHPEKKYGSSVAYMAEEFIEGKSPSDILNEELLKMGFYEKLGRYLGQVHLRVGYGIPRVTTESLEGSPIVINIDDEDSTTPKDAQKTVINEKRLIHSDCHLGNVLINEQGEIVVIDWGAAKFASPYAALQYLLMGSAKTKDNAHDVSRFDAGEALLLSVPFGGGWEVIPREHLEEFLKGYISANQECIKSLEEFEDPVLKLKLLFHKCSELLEHARWMDSFKPEQSEEKSQQEYLKEVCLNTLKQSLKRMADEAANVVGVDDAEKIKKLAVTLHEMIPVNEVLDFVTGHEIDQESLRNVDFSGLQSYDNETVEKISEGLKTIYTHLLNL